ncbi:MAG: hypothetical protein HYS86_05235 [Candidatus Chisholmbacteria bacterium]|nr:hypothetical protein [Candidatus Chisholmbacteria bacterium]
MPSIVVEEIIKLQPKGLITIPKKLRQGLFEEKGLARIKKERGRLIIEPLRTLPYPVRSYTDKELRGFLKLDAKETQELKKKGSSLF